MAPQAQPRLAQKTDWIDVLPPELWVRIGGMLQSGRDATSFRSMCTLWRDVFPFTKFAPVLMLPFDPDSPDGAVNFYRPSDGETISEEVPALRGKVVCGSSHGWLALVDQAACLTLLNPFTKATVALPPTDSQFAVDFSRQASMIDGRWAVQYSANGVLHEIELGDMRHVFFREVVLSSPADSGDCIAVAIVTDSSEVAFCRVGVDASWRLLHTDLTDDVRSIVHCRNRFLAISELGQVSICNVAGATPTARRVQSLGPPKKVSPISYLQVNGELHLVGTVVEKGYTYHTEVYKCNVFARRPVWSSVTNAGDVAMLTSHNFMAGHSGGSVSGLKNNAVYYSGHLGRFRYFGRDRNLDHGLEIVNIADGTSEWTHDPQNTQGSSEALCWIMQNPWTQGGLANA